MSRPQTNAARKSKQMLRGWKGPKRTPSVPPRRVPCNVEFRFDDEWMRDEFMGWLNGNLPAKFRVQR